MKIIIRKLMLAAVFAVALALFAVPSKAEALTLADLPIGSFVFIKENGVPNEFIKIDNGYPGYGTGSEGALLMRKLATASDSNGWAVFGDDYTTSFIDTLTENDYFNRLEVGVRNSIIPVELTCYAESTGRIWPIRRCWVLSATEMGYEGSNARFEGMTIAYFEGGNASRATTDDWGMGYPYATRTRLKGDDFYYFRVKANGTFEYVHDNTAALVRPCFLMPGNIVVGSGNNLVFNVAPTAPGSITATRNGNNISISWANSTDTDGNLTGYILERSVNGGIWSVVTNTNGTSFQDMISEDWTSAVYRVKAYDSGGLESAYTVSSVVPLPHITGIDVPSTIPHTGGDAAITVSGVNLHDGITVKVFDETTEILSGSTTGSDTVQSVTLPFPPNTSYTVDKAYTIKISLDGGTTWSSFTKTVVLERNLTPLITDVSVSPVHLSYGGGVVNVTVTGFNLPDGLLVEAYTSEDTIAGYMVGDDRTQASSLELPASQDYADATVYNVRASLDGGDNWFVSPMEAIIAARDLPAPVITRNLDVELALVEGDTLKLSIQASAEVGALSYQWYRDGVSIPGQDTDELMMLGITLADAGGYSCVVTTEIQDKTVSAVSRVCSVSVQKQADVPVILENLPEEKTVIEWHELSLSVTASCETGALSYEWFKDGTLISGETEAELLLPEAGLEDTGTYFCRITSTYGSSQKSVDGVSCDVTVQENVPVFESDLPDEQNVIEAHDLMLSVSAVSPAGEITYQWYRDNMLLTGETSPELRISSVTPEDGGEYFCRATATYGTRLRSADSNNCIVNVRGNVPEIVDNLPPEMTLIETQDLTLSVTATSPEGELSYAWYKGNVLIPRETEPTLQISSVTAAHAGLYFCRIVNTYGGMKWTVDSSVCAVSIQKGPATPVIEQDLEDSVTVASGSSLSLAASASSTNGTLSCQWHKDDAALPNATSSSLFIESVIPDDAGEYYCVFTNTIGDLTSSARTRTCLVIYDDPDAGPSPSPEPEPSPEPDPSPSPEPTPTSEPTPTPETSPSPSPEPSQRPSRTHRPKATTNPTPSPNTTSKPSLSPTLKLKADATPTLSPSVSLSPSLEPSPNLTQNPEPDHPISTPSASPVPVMNETSLSDTESSKQGIPTILLGIGMLGILGLVIAAYFIWQKQRKHKTY